MKNKSNSNQIEEMLTIEEMKESVKNLPTEYRSSFEELWENTLWEKKNYRFQKKINNWFFCVKKSYHNEGFFVFIEIDGNLNYQGFNEDFVSFELAAESIKQWYLRISKRYMQLKNKENFEEKIIWEKFPWQQSFKGNITKVFPGVQYVIREAAYGFEVMFFGSTKEIAKTHEEALQLSFLDYLWRIDSNKIVLKDKKIPRLI